MPRILFFYDYVDPLSWIMENRLTDLVDQGVQATIERIPFEIAPPGAPGVTTADPTWGTRTGEAVAAARADGLAYQPTALVPRSRKAIELAFLAAERGVFDRVHRALFEAHLSRGRDIGRVDLLVELAIEAGLDRTETKAVLDVDRHSDDVDAWRDRALTLGVSSPPTIWIAGKRLEGLVTRLDLEAALDVS